jgi:broad specificity phosphatase PhoE
VGWLLSKLASIGAKRPERSRMAAFSHIIVVRHGETEGQSSIRFHGVTDVPLSDEGREQVRQLARTLPAEGFDLVVASPLQRARETAAIIAPSSAVRIEPAFREIDFGRWEGLTAQEIEARDPELYREWQERRSDFDFPQGEARAAFRTRVIAGIDTLLAGAGEDTHDGALAGAGEDTHARVALIAGHKGVLRTIVEHLTEQSLDDPSYPPLGGAAHLVQCNAHWHMLSPGSRS